MKKIVLSAVVLLVVVAGLSVWALQANNSSNNEIGGRSLVALGDSVTAGDGLHATPESDPIACLRSDLAYPVLIAHDNGLALHQFACSGAKATTGLLQPQPLLGTGVQPPQLTAAKSYLKDSDVVLTIGANDTGSLYLLAKCAQQSTCLDSAQAASFQKALPELKTNLDQSLAMIKAEKPRRVVLNVYYDLLSQQDTCFAKFGLSPAKLKLIGQLQTQLNDVLYTSAKQADVIAVDIDFSGHGLCDQDSWVQSIGAGSPLHPTADGQRQIANQDEQALR